MPITEAVQCLRIALTMPSTLLKQVVTREYCALPRGNCQTSILSRSSVQRGYQSFSVVNCYRH